MLKKIIWVLCLVGWGSAWAQVKTPPRMNVAVMPFTGDGNTKQAHLDFITATFTGDLNDLKFSNVLDRGKIELIMQEQGLQQSGACASNECNLRIGQLLGMDYIISGQLVRLGESHALNIQFTDIRSGRIIKTIFERKNGRIENIFEDLCSQAAQRLVAGIQEEMGVQKAKILHPSQVKLPDGATNPPFVPLVEPEPFPWPKLFFAATAVASLVGIVYFSRETSKNVKNRDYYISIKNRTMADKHHEYAQNNELWQGFSYITLGLSLVSIPLYGNVEAK